jgi:hypothetical protein
MQLEHVPPWVFWLIWPFVAGMLLAAFFALGRIGAVAEGWPQWIFTVGLWGFTVVMALGAVFNALIPRFWDRWVFAPIFLVLACCGLVLALPERRTGG